MNLQLRFVAWLMLFLVATSGQSFAGEKVRRATTERTTAKRYTTYSERTYVRERRTYDADSVAADVIIARPAWFAETVVGAGLFVIALPFAAASGTIHETAHALVGKPGRATFRRQPGDFSTIE